MIVFFAFILLVQDKIDNVLPLWLPGSWRVRQRKPESGAFAGFGFHTYAPVQVFDDHFTNG